jgi:hypothetical protein
MQRPTPHYNGDCSYFTDWKYRISPRNIPRESKKKGSKMLIYFTIL